MLASSGVLRIMTDGWVNEKVISMFALAGLNRAAFNNISKSTIPIGIDALVLPLKIPTVVSDSSLKTCIYCVIIIILNFEQD